MVDAFEQHERNVKTAAIRGSGEAIARYIGMKIRAETEPPTAAPWHFPYSHSNLRMVDKRRGERVKKYGQG